MTIPLVKPGGWAVNEKLTSHDQSTLDTHVTWALDKRSGQTDTCASAVTFTNGIVFNGPVGFNNPLTVADTVNFQANITTQVTCTAQFLGAVTLTGAVTAQNFTMTGTNLVKLASRSRTLTIAEFFVGVTGSWQVDLVGEQATTTNGLSLAVCPVVVPSGVTITQIRVWVQPPNGHAGLPAVLPAVNLFFNNPTAAAGATGIASQGDTSATVGAYEALHAITMSGLSYSFNRSAGRIVVGCWSESGMDALSGFKIVGMDVTFTTTAMDDVYSN